MNQDFLRRSIYWDYFNKCLFFQCNMEKIHIINPYLSLFKKRLDFLRLHALSSSKYFLYFVYILAYSISSFTFFSLKVNPLGFWSWNKIYLSNFTFSNFLIILLTKCLKIMSLLYFYKKFYLLSSFLFFKEWFDSDNFFSWNLGPKLLVKRAFLPKLFSPT